MTRLALHAATVMHTNVVTDIRVAREAGYDAIELWIPKLARYLDTGLTVERLREELGPLEVAMLDTLLPIESTDPRQRAELLATCERMAAVAAELECPAIQVVALDGFAGAGWADQRAELARSLQELGAIAGEFGVRLAVEPVVFSRFDSVAQALELIESVGADRLGLCLDTWHLWTSGEDWEQVAALDSELILTVHLGDTLERAQSEWRDEDRGALPGEGVVPMAEAIAAIRATGYDGVWTVEMKGREQWEWDPAELAAAALQRTRALMTGTD
jgi:sugar phosphate isomerase/epimerase